MADAGRGGQGQLPEGKMATDKQIGLIQKLMNERKMEPKDVPNQLKPYLTLLTALNSSPTLSMPGHFWFNLLNSISYS